MSEVTTEKTHTEWGIEHSQGRATCSSELYALDQFPGFLARYEANFRNKVRPQIVRREVGPWLPVHQLDETPPSGEAGA